MHCQAEKPAAAAATATTQNCDECDTGRPQSNPQHWMKQRQPTLCQTETRADTAHAHTHTHTNKRTRVNAYAHSLVVEHQRAHTHTIKPTLAIHEQARTNTHSAEHTVTLSDTEPLPHTTARLGFKHLKTTVRSWQWRIYGGSMADLCGSNEPIPTCTLS